MSILNLVSSLPSRVDEEFIENLVVGRGVRVERIVSFGQASPSGFWYDQNEAEFVIVLGGRARLEIEGRKQEHVLGPGDAIYLPAHCRHRVVSTDTTGPTVWLAVFLDSDLFPAPAGLLADDASPRTTSE
ncbi:MAG: cupin domain-containing protein [Hyphomicrobiaceae bacterium]|nr:cupin domain-containing protein [Hyphomicrobiaceae bacterium]MCC0006669.1 cupin domain-containing protein [Hyphomicrobiaceae bacterium]